MNDLNNSIDHLDPKADRHLLRRIIGAYDSALVRAYCHCRFLIININILHILGLCMKGKMRILDIGCGFGLFGCYFAARYPGIQYHGLDLNENRMKAATLAAQRLGLTNARFECRDARSLNLHEMYDAVIMIDLMHHLPLEGKRHVFRTVQDHLAPGGCLIIKDVMRRPAYKLFFTWALDVLMTKSFEMWYWNPRDFREAVDPAFSVNLYPISDWLPYPHIVYLFDSATAPPAESFAASPS